jgi:rhodanese-related sulfurtransferase
MFSRLWTRLTTTTSVPAIEHEELLQAYLNGTCTVVDVREPHELSQFDPAHIPHGKPVVLICQAGARSAAALQRALAVGRQDVRHYPGGMAGWRAHKGVEA